MRQHDAGKWKEWDRDCVQWNFNRGMAEGQVVNFQQVFDKHCKHNLIHVQVFFYFTHCIAVKFRPGGVILLFIPVNVKLFKFYLSHTIQKAKSLIFIVKKRIKEIHSKDKKNS